MAERVHFNADLAAGLHLAEAIEEHPANQVRSVSRLFCSELEDKPWYYDKDFWRGYLDVLAASRFNRFNFTFGLGYDFPRGVTGDYFHFPYPYLVEVPGYDVRVVRLTNEAGEQNLPPFTAEEREKNLQTLRFIAAETRARGLEFQLGIWTHAYEWTDSPHAHHRIEGLTPETHAAYCRDALAMILKACPQIQGLTLRVHGESGIPEGSYPFWKTLFEAISGCGRKIEIDMHAKGVNQTMIDMATATGMPVKLGAKYSAEHQSLGYNQADIRQLEIPTARPHGKRRLQRQQWRAPIYSLWLCRLFAAGPALRFAVSLMAGNAAALAFRRSGNGGGLRTHFQLLRRGRAGYHGAAHLQRTRGVGAARRPLCLRGPIAQSEIGRLGKV